LDSSPSKSISESTPKNNGFNIKKMSMGQIQNALNIGVWSKAVANKKRLYWSSDYRLEGEEDQIDADERVGEAKFYHKLHERGDEDARRHRAYIYYVRQQKTRGPSKADLLNNDDWSSSDEEVHSNKLQIRGWFKGLVNKLIKFKDKSKKDREENKLSIKDSYNKRRQIARNISEQKLILSNLMNEKNSLRRQNLIVNLSTLSDNLESIEKDIQNEKQTKKEKKKEKDVDKIEGVSDDDELFDQTINMIITNNQVTKDCLLISPDSSGKAAWEVAGLFMIVYQSILIPFRLCFESEAEGWIEYFESAIDLCFMLDILVQFNTGFYKKGNLVLNRREIITNYLSTWFFIDIVASFPYNWLIDESALDQDTMLRTPQLLRLMKMARFLRFLRLLRVFKLK
jgi:hypothetical protein